jgi:hypothetical protein
MSRYCPIDLCNKRTHYGLIGEPPSRCSKHATSDMIRTYKKNVCSFEGCKSVSPSFGILGEKERFCKKHSTNDMINLKHKTCEVEGCNIINPVFDLPGGKGRFCLTHRTSEMIDVKHNLCKYKDCRTRPIFAKVGCKAEFCKNHKSDDMIDVTSKKRCEYTGCNIIATFDFKEGKGRFCSKHQLDGMINITARLCNYEGCNIISSFGKPGGKAEFCKKHSSKDMIDCINKHCVYEGCYKLNPVYNFLGEKPKYCKIHSSDGMIDISNPMCNECYKRAIYGIPGNKPTSCFEHRKPGMIKRSNFKCKLCRKKAIYGINNMAIHCEEHKTDCELNLIERECISCHLTMVLDKDNKCEYCNPAIFNTVRLAKQTALLNYLDSKKLHGTSTDKIVDGGICGRERPDRVFELIDKVIILECDENQHKDRNCSCEQTRMINIGNSFGGLPVYFIRWNPDDYIPEIDKSFPEKIDKRYKILSKFLLDIINNKISLPNALISAFYMFYDGWDCLPNEKWNILTKYDNVIIKL